MSKRKFPWLQDMTCSDNTSATHPTVNLVGQMGTYYATVDRAKPQFIRELLRRSNLHDALSIQIAKQAVQIECLKASLQGLVDKHIEPHGFEDSGWYARELEIARAVLKGAKS